MSSRSIEREVERAARRALRSSVGPSNLLEEVAAFSSAVTWADPLIITLLSFHAVLLLAAIVARRSTTIHISMLVLALGGVMGASWLNELGGQHWKEIGASQNYFDPQGLFMSTLLSGPLILISFGIVVYNVMRASQMLIVVKRKQLLGQQAAKAKAATAAAAAAKDAPTAGATSSSTTTTTTTTRVQAASMRSGDVDGHQPPPPSSKKGGKDQ